MILNNLKIVCLDKVIEKGYLEIEGGIIKKIGSCSYTGKEDSVDYNGLIAFPGFIDVHIHGSSGIDFMSAKKEDYKIVSSALYEEGVTSYLATTLTSDQESLVNVAKVVKAAKLENPSLLGIHLEGPYISKKYKGAQNEKYIRDFSSSEIDELIKESGNLVKYISLAPEKEGSSEFIEHCVKNGITVSAGHTDATFEDIEKAIKSGLTNTTHTHNAMSPHHHRNPGVVTAAMYFDELFTEVISDFIHVSKNTIKTFYKIVGPERFMIITDSLCAKHSDLTNFSLFGLDCIKKDGALYLSSGPLAGSLLEFDKGLRNIKEVTNASLIDLMKISSYNQSRCLHLKDRGLIEENRLADIVLMDDSLFVKHVYKEGNKVL